MSTELPKWKCHKVVEAFKIASSLRCLVLAVEREDNPRDEGLSQYSDEMECSRKVIAKAESRQ